MAHSVKALFKELWRQLLAQVIKPSDQVKYHLQAEEQVRLHARTHFSNLVLGGAPVEWLYFLPHEISLLSHAVWSRLGATMLRLQRLDTIAVSELLVKDSHQYGRRASYAHSMAELKITNKLDLRHNDRFNVSCRSPTHILIDMMDFSGPLCASMRRRKWTELHD